MCKAIKIKDLLRNGRRHLPELLLALDRIKPLDLMTRHGLELIPQNSGFKFDFTW
jgi:hypothetical protein